MAKKHYNGSKGQLGKKLLSYSMAAGATLALAHPAGAEVLYSGLQNIPINPMSSPLYIDLNGDNNQDFTFTANSATTEHFVKLAPESGNWGLKPDSPSQFLRLPAGYPISQSAIVWVDAIGVLQFGHGVDPIIPQSGYFINQTGYIGVRIKAGAEDQFNYCWIHYQGDGFSEGRIIDWACDTRVGEAIRAGDTGAGPEAVPTLNQWGLMILAGLILSGGTRRLKRNSST